MTKHYGLFTAVLILIFLKQKLIFIFGIMAIGSFFVKKCSQALLFTCSHLCAVTEMI